MAFEINQTYANRPLTIVGVLTGSVVLLADIIRQMTMPLRVGVVQASSYRGATSRGPLVINSDLMPDIADHHVVIVDAPADQGFQHPAPPEYRKHHRLVFKFSEVVLNVQQHRPKKCFGRIVA